MQRRHTLLAVALVALVLVPAAAMAGGFGPKHSPLGPTNSRAAPDWAGNATALRANASAGDGACLGDATCDRAQLRNGDRFANQTGARNGTRLSARTAGTDRVCDGDQDRDRLRDGTGNRTAAPNGERLAFQDRPRPGRCR